MTPYNGSPEHIANILAAKEKATIRQRELKLARIEEYNKSPILCACCSTPLPYEFKKAKRKYCGSSCAAKSNNVGRVRSTESKLKISEKLRGRTVTRATNAVVKLCESCEGEMKLSPSQLSKRFCCKACYTMWTSTPAGRQARSEIAQATVASGKHQGWRSRKGRPTSYPEQYFASLFEAEGIVFEREVKCGKYFIDFVVGELAVEIDGSQHEYPDHMVRDAQKDIHLTEAGYQVVRIKWSNPRTQSGKNRLYPQIEMLKELITRSKLNELR